MGRMREEKSYLRQEFADAHARPLSPVPARRSQGGSLVQDLSLKLAKDARQSVVDRNVIAARFDPPAFRPGLRSALTVLDARRPPLCPVWCQKTERWDPSDDRQPMA